MFILKQNHFWNRRMQSIDTDSINFCSDKITCWYCILNESICKKIEKNYNYFRQLVNWISCMNGKTAIIVILHECGAIYR